MYFADLILRDLFYYLKLAQFRNLIAQTNPFIVRECFHRNHLSGYFVWTGVNRRERSRLTPNME